MRDGVPIPITAEGIFEFHGVTKTSPIQGETTWLMLQELARVRKEMAQRML